MPGQKERSGTIRVTSSSAMILFVIKIKKITLVPLN